MEEHFRAALLEYRRNAWTVLLVLIFLGIALISVSVALPEPMQLLKELLKELGIVLVAVFGVSMFYEILIAERHFHRFFGALRGYIETGESNGAVCARIGILEIVPTRDVFEQKHPLPQLIGNCGSSSKIRVVGTSLFLLMTRLECLKSAVQQGAAVEFCSLDPDYPSSERTRWIPQLAPSDVTAAMERFNEFAKWLDETKPPGTVELRHHQLPLFDSYASFEGTGTKVAVWDLSFGADITKKRIFLVDTTKGVGADLAERYDRIWRNSTLKLRYPKL